MAEAYLYNDVDIEGNMESIFDLGDRINSDIDSFGKKYYLHKVLKKLHVPSPRTESSCRPTNFIRDQWINAELALSEKIVRARIHLNHVTYLSNDLKLIANINTEMHIDGHRADLVVLKTARAQAAFDRRFTITSDDIQPAVVLALPHRLKHHPLDSTIDNIDLMGFYTHIIDEYFQSTEIIDHPVEKGVLAL